MDKANIEKMKRNLKSMAMTKRTGSAKNKGVKNKPTKSPNKKSTMKLFGAEKATKNKNANKKETIQVPPFFKSVYPHLVKLFPNIKRKLELAEVKNTPEQYVFKSTRNAFIQTIALLILTGIGFYMYNISFLYLILLSIIYFFAMLWYNSAFLDVLIKRRQRSIDFEIIYLLRYLIVSSKSGVPIYDALVNISNKYGAAGETIGEVVRLAALGNTLQQALVKVAQKTPSAYMERVLIQLSNSLSSGSELSDSLSSILKQISDEEMIKLKSYGRRLTPFTMFYMIFGIIVPSIGVVLSVVMLSIMGSGAGFKLDGSVLALIVLILAVVQYLFLGMIKQGRPKYIV